MCIYIYIYIIHTYVLLIVVLPLAGCALADGTRSTRTSGPTTPRS